MEGRLLDIALHRAKRAPMKTLESVVITETGGLEGDFRGGGVERRQVTVLCIEKWNEACRELGAELSWTVRRGNLLIEGINLDPSTKDRKLGIGNEVVLLITGETEPCDRMDEQQPGLKAALATKEGLPPEWRAGVTCRVLRGGTIRRGDAVYLIA